MNCIKCRAALPAGALFCPLCGKKQSRDPRRALKRANGMGTVYRLQGRRTRPWVAAKNRVIIGYYEKKTDALEALERLTGRDLTERYNMTFAEVFQEWSAEHYKTIGPHGIVSYNRSYDMFQPLHEKTFRSLRTKDFQNVVDQYMHMSLSALSKMKQLITQMSRWAMREEITTSNFASFVTLKKEEKKEKAVFTEEEIKRLEADGSDDARIVLMLLSTGMRIGELFALRLEDYHETYVVGGSKTDAGRNRVIPIRPEGRPHFAYFAAKSDGGLLLSQHSRKSAVQMFRKARYYPLLERLGIERKTPHATRHTYATRAVMEGMKPEVLQKILGHEKYETTAEIYTHIGPDALVSAVEFVSNPLVTESDSN